jgi:hypothetical protein
MAAMTSARWLAEASPSDEVQVMLFAISSSTLGNCASALTDGSQDMASTVFFTCALDMLVVALRKVLASTNWSGNVAAPRICATSASG